MRDKDVVEIVVKESTVGYPPLVVKTPMGQIRYRLSWSWVVNWVEWSSRRACNL